MYFREYAEVWWDFLNSIQYRGFRDLNEAVSRLKKIGDPSDSPLFKLLEGITQETLFTELKSKAVLQKGIEAIEKIGQKRQKEEEVSVSPQNFLRTRFGPIHSLCQIPEGIPSEHLSSVFYQFITVSNVIEELTNSSDSRMKDYVARIIEQSEGEIPDAIHQIRNSLSNMDSNLRELLFEMPIKTAWKQIVDRTQTYLNTIWKQQVYARFSNTLASYYPFDRQGNDAPISDLEYFFQPLNGILWKFVEEELASFIDRGSWEPHHWEDYGISLSQDTKEALKKAEEITRGLFSQGSLGLQFRLQPDLPESISANAPVIEQITINIDGKQHNYRMGSQSWIDFLWPGREGMPGASLRLFSRGGNYEVKSYQSEWGLFHLLDNTLGIRMETASFFKLFWLFETSDKKQVIVNYRLDAMSSFSPFKDYKEFFRFVCPSQLNE
jgi:type VI secretion system protein ImpL